MRLRRGEPGAPIDHARKGVEIVSHIGARLGEAEGAGARDALSGCFDVGLAAAYAEQSVEDMVFFCEQGRAASLRAGSAYRAVEAAALRKPLLEALHSARAAHLASRRALAQARRVKDLRAARQHRAEMKTRAQAVEDAVRRIQREAKSAAAFLLPEPDSVETIQGRLGKAEALVYFASTTAEMYAVVLRRKAARMVRLGPSLEIAGIVDALLSGSRHIDPKHVDAMRRMIIDPLKLAGDVRRVLLSPAGTLSYVPLALLLQGKEIAYVPSATIHGLLREEHSKPGARVLGLGAPNYRALVDKRAQEAYAKRSERLTPLPATAVEVRAVADVTLLGDQATEARLRSTLAASARWRAVHFACHGLVDARNPMRSSLAVTPGGEDDGFLTCLEVYAMRIPADLAVLSACETSRGRVYKTDGVLGLAHSFMLAGAPRVLCSLWKVDDRATQALMVKFYELWNPKGEKEGLSATQALRAAQEHVRSKPEWAHPYYWGAWVLWGLPD